MILKILLIPTSSINRRSIDKVAVIIISHLHLGRLLRRFSAVKMRLMQLTQQQILLKPARTL